MAKKTSKGIGTRVTNKSGPNGDSRGHIKPKPKARPEPKTRSGLVKRIRSDAKKRR